MALTVGGLYSATLLGSAARTVTAGTGGAAYTVGDDYLRAWFYLDVTAAATDAGDTLDVWVQRSQDEGTTWDDLCRFTQCAGNGGAKAYRAYWCGYLVPTTPQAAQQTATMAAGVEQGGVLGSQLRAYWKIVDADANGSFTFSVAAVLATR